MRDGKIIQMGFTGGHCSRRLPTHYVEDFVRDVSKTRLMGAGSIMEDPAVKALATHSPSPSRSTPCAARALTIASVVDSGGAASWA